MGTYKRWSDAEIHYIKDNLNTFSDTELAIKLSEMTGETVTTGMIRRQRRKIGVSKPRGRRKKNVETNNS